MYSIFVFCVLLSVTAAANDFCDSEGYAHLVINHLSDPIILREGAKVSVDFKVAILKKFPTKIVADVTLKRKVWFVWIPIPCVSNVGSCKYTVTCEEINKMQAKNGGNVEYPCPAEPGNVDRNFSFTLPKIPGIVSAVGSGSYEVSVILRDENGKKLACARRKAEVKT